MGILGFFIRDVAQLMSTTTWQKTDFVKCKYSSDLGNKTRPEKLQKLKSATKKTLKCHTNLERVAINRLYYHACVRGEAKQMQVSSELSCGLVFSVSSKLHNLWYLDEFIFLYMVNLKISLPQKFQVNMNMPKY